MSLTNDSVLFREEQRFRQPWLWVLLAASAVPALVIGVLAITAWGDRWVGTIVLALVLGMPLLFSRLTLRTEVRRDGLHLRFRPFVWHRHLRPEDLAEATARTYRPLSEYGGWGLRWGSSGIAYNVSSDRGVQLVLTDGKRLLVGSQRPEELAAAIEAMRSSLSSP